MKLCARPHRQLCQLKTQVASTSKKSSLVEMKSISACSYEGTNPPPYESSNAMCITQEKPDLKAEVVHTSTKSRTGSIWPIFRRSHKESIKQESKPSTPQGQRKPSPLQGESEPSTPQSQSKPSTLQSGSKPSIPQVKSEPSIPQVRSEPSTARGKSPSMNSKGTQPSHPISAVPLPLSRPASVKIHDNYGKLFLEYTGLAIKVYDYFGKLTMELHPISDNVPTPLPGQPTGTVMAYLNLNHEGCHLMTVYPQRIEVMLTNGTRTTIQLPETVGLGQKATRLLGFGDI